jgi:signal transduction histidine kinase
LMRLSVQNRKAGILAERNRMARDFHDTLAQGFTGIVVQMEAAEEALSQNLLTKVGDYIGRAGDLARESLREARRSVQALRPQALEEKKLCDALSSLMQKMTTGTGMQTVFAVDGAPQAIPPEWEENLLRIGQEVLTNALRHAQATEFKSQLVFDPLEIRFELKDNGRGFDVAGRHDGFGLQGMRERVESMGGHFTVESAPNSGTSVLIILPLAVAAASESS